MAGGGGGDRVPAGDDRGVEVRYLPDPLKPGLQGKAEVGQVAGAVGVAGGGGGDRVPAGDDRGVQVRHLPDPPKPGPQGGAEVGQPPGAVGVVGGGGRQCLGEQIYCLVQLTWITVLPGGL
ncbi:hypothetical protein [Candidatus Protofrankia datiscae]|uniref:hypothetical protein n=1 Tax=Candidatus Protofrankia datiscae TaxID=2716812 RepID=UPI00068099F4|nr:hypothetical protein [Candidatus Protofrankia datiscae]